MAKRAGVIITENQKEGLRMAVGLTLADLQVTVFVLDTRLEKGGETELNLSMLSEMKGRVCSNVPENPCERVSTGELAAMLLEQDAVLRY